MNSFENYISGVKSRTPEIHPALRTTIELGLIYNERLALAQKILNKTIWIHGRSRNVIAVLKEIADKELVNKLKQLEDYSNDYLRANSEFKESLSLVCEIFESGLDALYADADDVNAQKQVAHAIEEIGSTMTLKLMSMTDNNKAFERVVELSESAIK